MSDSQEIDIVYLELLLNSEETGDFKIKRLLSQALVDKYVLLEQIDKIQEEVNQNSISFCSGVKKTMKITKESGKFLKGILNEIKACG